MYIIYLSFETNYLPPATKNLHSVIPNYNYFDCGKRCECYTATYPSIGKVDIGIDRQIF